MTASGTGEITAANGAVGKVDLVDNADDDGADGAVRLQADDLARRVALVQPQHPIAHAGLHHVDGDVVLLVGHTLRRQPLNQQQLAVGESLVLDGRDDRSEDASDVHSQVVNKSLSSFSSLSSLDVQGTQGTISTWSTMPTMA